MAVELSVYRRDGVLLWAVLCLVGWVYAGALGGAFHFDDEHSLLDNPHVRDLNHAYDFFTDSQTFSRNEGSQMYRPLVLLSYALTYRWHGYEAGAFLAVNWLLHLAVVAVAFLCHRSIGLDAGRAALAVLLFGLHPVVAEPVNYVSARSESLAALFSVGAVALYLREYRWAALGSLALFALALMAKASAAVVPIALIVAELSLLGSWRSLRWQRLSGFALVLGCYIWGTQSLVSEALIDAPVRSLAQQAATQTMALMYYAKLAVGLQGQTVEHQFFVAHWHALAVWLSAACVLSAGALGGCWLWHYQRRAFFYGVWAVLALLPTLVVPLNTLVNERRLYLPLVALTALVALLPLRWSRRAKGLAAVVVACAWALMAAQRCAVWQSEWTLWTEARERAPLMARPHVKIGVQLRARGDFQGALRAYEQALQIDGQYAPALNNMGNVYRQMGDEQGAEAAYRRALAIWPHYVDALINLATLYSEGARLEEAHALYARALQFGNGRAELHNNMGTNFLRMGDYASAEQALRQALVLAGETPRIHYNLGGALEGMDRLVEALDHYGWAVALDSTYAPPYAKMGAVSERLGDGAAARVHYAAFLRHWSGARAVASDVAQRMASLPSGEE